jgi:RNAse (barnase) inhibitor barstar
MEECKMENLLPTGKFNHWTVSWITDRNIMTMLEPDTKEGVMEILEGLKATGVSMGNVNVYPPQSNLNYNELLDYKEALTDSDKLKLDILYDVLTQQVEYTMSLEYNNEEYWTVEERVEALIEFIKQSAKQTAQEIVDYHGIGIFSQSIQDRIKEGVSKRGL